MRRLLVVLLCGLLLPALPAAAQNTPGLTLTVQAGYGGSYRTGEWFPVTVDITNDGADLRGQLEWDVPGSSEQLYHYTLDLPRGSRKRIQFSAFARSYSRSAVVRVRVDARVLAEQSVALEPFDADRFTIGVVSSDPTLLNSLTQLTIGNATSTVVWHIAADQLPQQVLALRSLNALFLHDLDASQLSQPQREALEMWVSLGGQLITGGGVAGQKVTNGLGPFLPATADPGLREAAIEPLLNLSSQPLPNGATSAPITPLQPQSGSVDLLGGGLIYQGRYGSGRVSMAALDLALLRGWDGERAVWEQILAGLPIFSPSLGSRIGQSNLLERVLRLPELGLPSASMLTMLLLIYIIVIGPVNYLILRRMKRLEWAWFSIPLLVALFTGGLYLVGFGGRGDQAQINQLSIVQANEGLERSQVTGFLAIYSPRRATYTISFAPETLIHETRSWNQGGNNSLPVTLSETSASVNDLLVDIASVRSLVAEQTMRLPAVVESQGPFAQQNPVGQVRNTSGMALEDALVVYNGSMLSLGTIEPGVSRSFNFGNAQPTFPWGTSLSTGGTFDRNVAINSLFSGEATLFSNDSNPLAPDSVYLIAWTATPTVPLQVNGNQNTQSGQTMYVIRLRG